MYIISACLLGQEVKYNGGSNANEKVIAFAKTHRFAAVCPETLGGLTSPRPPAERIGDKVMDREGRDVTAAFLAGAEKALKQALAAGEEIEGAILKANSPSCGRGAVYDGTFTGRKVEGNGVFAQLLLDRGIPVFTEEDIVADKGVRDD